MKFRKRRYLSKCRSLNFFIPIKRHKEGTFEGLLILHQQWVNISSVFSLHISSRVVCFVVYCHFLSIPLPQEGNVEALQEVSSEAVWAWAVMLSLVQNFLRSFGFFNSKSIIWFDCSKFLWNSRVVGQESPTRKVVVLPFINLVQCFMISMSYCRMMLLQVEIKIVSSINSLSMYRSGRRICFVTP